MLWRQARREDATTAQEKNKAVSGEFAMIFEKTTMEEIDAIIRIVSDARSRIGSLGIDQWQCGYPSRDVIAEDIFAGRSYVARDDDGSICAVFTVIFDGEPTYDKIFDGAWASEGRNYLAVHRIAVSGEKLRCGAASRSMTFVETMAKEMGRSGVRIDTHEGNVPMRAMLERNGYVHCGSIYLETGEHRVAYEKLV